jgi:hypothetical protein
MRIVVEPAELAASGSVLGQGSAAVEEAQRGLGPVTAEVHAWADPMVWQRLEALVDALDWALDDAADAARSISSHLDAAARAYRLADAGGRR